MEYAISIVIPVYNVHDYLQRCVDSVVEECSTFRYEAILVDDGSTDGSAEMCDVLAKQYVNVKVLHKHNGGLSDARNYGVVQAKGKYIFYLDSDDYLAEGGLRALLATAVNEGSDVVCGNFYYQYADHADLFCPEHHGLVTLQGGEEALRTLIEGRLYQNFAWGKLIRRELAQRHLFPKGKLFEDTYWYHNILHETNRVTVIDAPVVHYLQRHDSISYYYSVKSINLLDGYRQRLLFLKQCYPTLVSAHKTLMADICIQQAWMMGRYLYGAERQEALRKLRQIIHDCELQNHPCRGKRRQLTTIMLSLPVFMLFNAMERIRGRIKDGIR